MFGDAEGMLSADAVLVGGDDLLKGRGGDDLLYGDLDQLAGGRLEAGDDRLFGGAGNDTLFGDAARITGGTVARAGDDLLSGGAGNDALLGHGGADTLRGGSGNDTLGGEDGADILSGGGGADLLSGGTGADRMTGGTGPDTFVFRSGAETGAGRQRDVITDFDPGSDRLDLSGLARDSVTGRLEWTGDAWDGEAGTVGYTLHGARLKLVVALDVEGPTADAAIWLNGLSGLEAADVGLG
jgi:Ca2+-binding RTX toxin-like protein